MDIEVVLVSNELGSHRQWTHLHQSRPSHHAFSLPLPDSPSIRIQAENVLLILTVAMINSLINSFRSLLANRTYIYSLSVCILYLSSGAPRLGHLKGIQVTNAPGTSARIKNLHWIMWICATRTSPTIAARGSQLQLICACVCITHHLLQCMELRPIKQGWEFSPNTHHRVADTEYVLMNLMESLPTDNASIHVQNGLQIDRRCSMDWYFAPFFCRHIIDTHLENSGNVCAPESADSPDFEDCNPGCGKSCI